MLAWIAARLVPNAAEKAWQYAMSLHPAGGEQIVLGSVRTPRECAFDLISHFSSQLRPVEMPGRRGGRVRRPGARYRPQVLCA